MRYQLSPLRRLALLGLSGSALSMRCVCALAAGEAQPLEQLQAVTVSADKIVQPIEPVAGSVSVLEGWEVEQAGLSSVADVDGRIPGLSFQPFGQAGVNSPVMRG